MSRSERGRALAIAGAICAAAMLVSGCATPTPPPVAPAGDVRAWAGRFAVTWTPMAPPPRQESASGRFSLRDAPDRTELEVFSPFGQTVARALARPGTAVLETADGRRFEAQDPETLTESVLGWRAPVQMLPAWLRGDRADRLVESGWDVQVDARDNGRPQRLTLTWPAGIAPSPSARPRVTIRLVLDPADGSAPADGTR